MKIYVAGPAEKQNTTKASLMNPQARDSLRPVSSDTPFRPVTRKSTIIDAVRGCRRPSTICHPMLGHEKHAWSEKKAYVNRKNSKTAGSAAQRHIIIAL